MTFLNTVTSRAANFPDNFHFPGTEIPELFREIPGNSRELQTYYITNKKYPIFEKNVIFWRITMIFSFDTIVFDSKV